MELTRAWWGVVVGVAVAAVGLMLAPPLGAAATGDAVVVSHSAGAPATTGNGQSRATGQSISTDGRYVTFSSRATNLAAGQIDSNGSEEDVFLLDRESGLTAVVSHVPTNALTTANRGGQAPSISADGAFVVFRSLSTNLVAGQADSNNRANDEDDVGYDIFLYERATGTVTLVSHVTGLAATTGNVGSGPATVSADGRYVAFTSIATNLASGQVDANNASDAFLYDRFTGENTLVSHSATSAVTAANGPTDDVPAISADGGVVAFTSGATNLVAGQTDPNGGGAAGNDVFAFTPATGAVALVSHTPGSATTTASGRSASPTIDATGDRIAFESTATNLLPGQSDTNGSTDVFLFERSTDTMALVSHAPVTAITTANGPSGLPVIAAGGEAVGFVSEATNLVNGQSDTNGAADDYFLFAASTGVVTLASRAAGNAAVTGNAGSPSPALDVSGNGELVAFASSATNLVTGQSDTNGGQDWFLFDTRDGTTSLLSHVVASPTIAANAGAGDFTAVDISTPGRHVVFESSATNLAPGQSDVNGERDVFLVEVVGAGGPTFGDQDADGDADIAVFRPAGSYWFVNGGRTVAFGTSGDIPVPADYDADADADMAVFRPSNGYWFVVGGPNVAFGTSGDIPVPADYDGDGDADMAVFRPSNGYWFVIGGPTVQFGTSGDVPLLLPDAVRRFFFPPL
ncbi:MAG: hypothetical protein M3179_01235 [Actinomycetota bacterium]|nr:hypothetical protein [Actinomycetota bacterium]